MQYLSIILSSSELVLPHNQRYINLSHSPAVFTLVYIKLSYYLPKHTSIVNTKNFSCCFVSSSSCAFSCSFVTLIKNKQKKKKEEGWIPLYWFSYTDHSSQPIILVGNTVYEYFFLEMHYNEWH